MPSRPAATALKASTLPAGQEEEPALEAGRQGAFEGLDVVLGPAGVAADARSHRVQSALEGGEDELDLAFSRLLLGAHLARPLEERLPRSQQVAQEGEDQEDQGRVQAEHDHRQHADRPLLHRQHLRRQVDPDTGVDPVVRPVVRLIRRPAARIRPRRPAAPRSDRSRAARTGPPRQRERDPRRRNLAGRGQRVRSIHDGDAARQRSESARPPPAARPLFPPSGWQRSRPGAPPRRAAPRRAGKGRCGTRTG